MSSQCWKLHFRVQEGGGDGGGSEGSSFLYRIGEVERRGRGFCILPLSPSHYATFSLRVTESTRSGQESTKCGICYACKFNDVNIWLAMVGDKRNNTEVFRANDGLENECLY